jgi:NAD(P)H-quinone oxidoreductase subunit 4
MGFVFIRIGSIADISFSGAILQMVFHGLIGATLFFLARTSQNQETSNLRKTLKKNPWRK